LGRFVTKKLKKPNETGCTREHFSLLCIGHFGFRFAILKMLMPQPNPFPEPSQGPLPLFRAEALAAQQHKFYGEILLIRPLSLALFFWLGIGISAVVLGFLLLGSYAEKVHVTGAVVPGENGGLQADLYVPARVVQFLHTGESIRLHCQSCSGQESQANTGRVSEIFKSVVGREEIAAESKITVQEPMYKIKLTLAQAGAGPLPAGARLEADLPLGRKPLLQWLFERESAQSSAKAAGVGDATQGETGRQ
jgi:hypothetical protein